MGKNLNFKNWGNSINKLFGGGKKNAGPPPNVSKYGNIQMPTQHSSLGFNWTYLSQGKPGERFIYTVANAINTTGQFFMGRGVGDYSMRNLDGSATSTDEAVSGFVDVYTSVMGIAEAKIALSELKAARAAMSSKDIILVTKNGVALPKGARIPNNFIENPWRAGDYGEIINGSFKSRVRIDQATMPSFKGPKTNHFHLNNGKEHIFDISRWPWWNN